MTVETTCPDCNGRGHSFGFVERADRSQSSAGQIACTTCDGIGAVSPEKAVHLALCGQVREKRRFLNLSTARAACLLGIMRREMSDIEFGRANAERTQWALDELEKRPPYDAEKEAAEDERVKEFVRCIEEGISPCCKTPLNLSCVIPNGRYKGHGPRYCRTCGQEVSRA